MGWKNYRTFYDGIKKEAKKEGKTPLPYNLLYEKVLERLFRQENDADNRRCKNQMITEYYWIDSGKPTIYLQTEELASMLLDARYEAGIIEQAMAAIKDGEVFSVIPCETSGAPRSLFMVQKGCFFITTQCDDVKGANLTQVGAIRYSTINTFVLERKKHKGNVFQQNTDLILGLLVYLQAFPDSIRPGFPDGMSNYEQKQQNTARAFRIGLPAKYHNSPVSHWRSGHFRRLLDERFKRDEQGRARIIYVNPCLVGEKVDPYTVEGRKC